MDMIGLNHDFIKSLIEAYRRHPCLWKVNSSHYKDRYKKAKAYEVLARLCRRYVHEADREYVKNKINSLRTSFRKEWRKVQASKKDATHESQIYKPRLWYYDLISFTGRDRAEEDVGEGEEKKEEEEDEDDVIVGDDSGAGYDEEVVESEEEEREEKEAGSPNSTGDENLRGVEVEVDEKDLVFFKEEPLREYSLASTLPTEVDEAINYLPANKTVRLIIDRNEHADSSKLHSARRKRSSAVSDDSNMNKVQKLQPQETQKPEDIYDVIGRNVAYKLRSMIERQRIIAEKIVSDVMYHGQMEHLTEYSGLKIE